MADRINLEIITPERRVLSESVDEVVVPALSGELGILPEHAPLISQLKTGVLNYRLGNERRELHISGGFVEVLSDRVAVLSDVAERPEEIDLERARRAKERAERRLASKDEEIDFRRAELKLQRALVRIQLAGR
jgi:F-type H+-transporting ATPase subunit epsilon